MPAATYISLPLASDMDAAAAQAAAKADAAVLAAVRLGTDVITCTDEIVYGPADALELGTTWMTE